MIPGVLELASRTKYGMTSRNVPIYLFRPLNQKLAPCIVGCSKNLNKNVLALVEVPHWTENKLSRGNLNRILGECGDFKAENEALTYQYRRKSWPAGFQYSVPPSSTDRHIIAGRSFNIDPPDCRDVDDVFTIGDDGYYYITIADVAEWMKVNPTSFQNAHDLGQTLYSISGRIIQPMIPFEKECSLLPSTSLNTGISLRFRIDGNKISDPVFLKTLLRNDMAYTYETIYHSPYVSTLRDINRIISGEDSNDSHDWIANLMILYNTEAAKVLKQKSKGILRHHESPDMEKLEIFKHLGVDAKFLAFKSAKYVPATFPAHHWGLGTDTYCHATSPIRRFADIVNQFVLKNEEIPAHVDINFLNNREKELKQYSRDSFFLHEIEFSKSRKVGGIILNDHRVWVPSWKRIVTCRTDFKAGTQGVLNFSLDMTQSTWKKRMVFRFC